MKACILTIGHELLYGDTVNSNAAWMASEMAASGIIVGATMTVGDEHDAICEGLDWCLQRADVVITTGGLGPTNDDLTKATLSAYFDSELVFNEDIFEGIKAHFAGRDLAFIERNRAQAEVPTKSEFIPNAEGTAPGLVFRRSGKVVIALPGVPREMKSMMRNFVLPMFEGEGIPMQHRYVMTAGLAESALAETLAPFEALLDSTVSLAYLPSPGQVKLRLSSQVAEAARMDELQGDLLSRLDGHVYGTDPNQTLSTAIADVLTAQGATLAIGESCTGGNISSQFVAQSGASSYFLGGVVAYADDIKVQELEVDPETLREHGAVSEEVVLEMLNGVVNWLGADYGLTVSGIAGPGGGTEQKPVGTIYVAVGDKQNASVRRLRLSGSRKHIIATTTNIALHMLYRWLLAPPAEEEETV